MFEWPVQLYYGHTDAGNGVPQTTLKFPERRVPSTCVTWVGFGQEALMRDAGIPSSRFAASKSTIFHRALRRRPARRGDCGLTVSLVNMGFQRIRAHDELLQRRP